MTVRPFANASGSARSAYVSWNGKYVGKQFYDNTASDDRAVPAYFVADLSAGYEFPLRRKSSDPSDNTPAVALSFHVNNMFNNMYFADAWVWRAYFHQSDSYYAETGLYPQAPANFMFKLSYRF